MRKHNKNEEFAEILVADTCLGKLLCCSNRTKSILEGMRVHWNDMVETDLYLGEQSIVAYKMAMLGITYIPQKISLIHDA